MSDSDNENNNDYKFYRQTTLGLVLQETLDDFYKV